MEFCEICYCFRTKYYLICTNGHSICLNCFQKVKHQCPFCSHPLLQLTIFDLSRSKIIESKLSFFFGDIKKGCIIDIDAKDKKNNWYMAQIIEVDNQLNKIKVHYHGWDAKWDDWIPINSEFCLPLHSITVDFLSMIHYGQMIEYRISRYLKKPRWYRGKIIEVSQKNKYVKIMNHEDTIIKIRLDKSWLCPLGTHTPSCH